MSASGTSGPAGSADRRRLQPFAHRHEATIADEIGVRQLEIEARRFQEEPLGAKGAAIGRSG